MRIRIISFNCFDVSLYTISVRRRRIQKIISAIIVESPDIICLQEVVFPDATYAIRSALEKGGYHVYAPKIGFLTSGGLVTASKFPITESQNIRFHDQGKFISMDIVERIIRKGFHRITLALPDNKQLALINTQLHCPFGAYTSKIPSITSQHQYNQLAEVIPQKMGILSGDLNIIPANKLYKQFTQHLVDPLAGTTKKTISMSNSHRRYLPRYENRIDYTLLTRDLARSAIMKIIFDRKVPMGRGKNHHLSDHFGLRTEINVP